MRALAIMLMTLLSACSPVGMLNALAPTDGVTITPDIVYGQAERQLLDVYTPKQAPAPVIVFLYGGGWRSGDKAMYGFVASALAARGYVTVVPDYRLYPTVRFPAFIRDAARAVQWTRREIARFGGDPCRIVLMGHSAGAYIAAMLALDRQWLAEQDGDADRDLAGVVGLSGPYDFLPLRDPALQAIFAPAGNLRDSQPISFVRGDAPPMLLAHGDFDSVVWPRNTTRLAEAIRRQGGQVETRLYPGVGHAALVGAMAGPLRWLAPVMSDVDAFVAARPATCPTDPAGAAA
jgi:acetyl esterase/lipase